MNLKVKLSNLAGKIDPIASKSTIHRSLICALLSQSITTIEYVVDSEDVNATLNVLKMCNCKITKFENKIIIDSRNLKLNGQINVNESGSTLRFIVPVLLFLFNEVNIDASNGLRNRPHDVLIEILNQSGVKYEKIKFPMQFTGELKAKKYYIPANVSSQFISGMLFVLPLLEEKSEIIFTTNVESRGYLDLTIKVLSNFGIEIEETEYGYVVNGKQKYLENTTYVNEVDESNLAFWHVANHLGAKIEFSRINQQTFQPDAIIRQILSENRGEVSVANCPDLLPILCVYGLSREGGLLIKDTKRTMIKESNRLMVMKYELEKLGAKIEIMPNYDMKIHKIKKLNESIVDSNNDHRIVMALSIAALLCNAGITICNIGAVNKSYPNFFAELSKLGGKINKS